MDGNGRWAKQRGLPKVEGHRAGAAAVEEAVQGCIEQGVEILSLYAFSTENWQRPKHEVNTLMKLLGQYLRTHLTRLQKNKVRLLVLGERNGLPISLQKQIKYVIEKTKCNSKLILNLAINYGGREEILQAVKSIALKVKQNQLQLKQIDERVFSEHLYTEALPDPDLLIRTSGEQRVSNFFLWQINYSEFYFTSKLWPDFKKEDLYNAILDFQKRERRFGA
jgi:undecaprenyl diphosphate synthase